MSPLYIFAITSFILASIYYSLLTKSSLNNQPAALSTKGRNNFLFPDEKTIHNVQETWVAAERQGDNIDSLALYRDATDNDMKIIATAKNANRFFIYDADKGIFERDVERIEDLERPNGLTWLPFSHLHKDRKWLLVTERDSRRVTIFSVPDFKIIHRFGTDQLLRPYATVVRARHYSPVDAQTKDVTEIYDIYVSDGFMDLEYSEKKKRHTHSKVPNDEKLGERMKLYTLYVKGNKVERVEFEKSFGDTAGEGKLLRVESVMSDEVYDHLLIADEESLDIKVYTWDGKFTGIRFGQGYFSHEPEGLALFECPESIRGFWITTDQRPNLTHFHVFSRGSYQYMGSFQGNDTSHTDGIALTQESFGQFPEGALIALHADASITAFDWSDIAQALNLKC